MWPQFTKLPHKLGLYFSKNWYWCLPWGYGANLTSATVICWAELKKVEGIRERTRLGFWNMLVLSKTYTYLFNSSSVWPTSYAATLFSSHPCPILLLPATRDSWSPACCLPTSPSGGRPLHQPPHTHTATTVFLPLLPPIERTFHQWKMHLGLGCSDLWDRVTKYTKYIHTWEDLNFTYWSELTNQILMLLHLQKINPWIEHTAVQFFCVCFFLLYKIPLQQPEQPEPFPGMAVMGRASP